MDGVSSLLLNNFDSLHLRCGPKYRDKQLLQAYVHLENKDDMKAIYHMTESLVPSLREKALYQLATAKVAENLYKEFVEFPCHNVATIDARVLSMLQNIEQLPKEWHIVHITQEFNIFDTVKNDPNKYTTNPLNICVFNCGQIEEKPVCFTTCLPFSPMENKNIELLQRLKDIQKDINTSFCAERNLGIDKIKIHNREYYTDRILNVGNDLQQILHHVESLWIKEYKCLFIGKYIDNSIEANIRKEVVNLIEENNLSGIEDKLKTLLYYLMKSSCFLNLKEIKILLEMIVPGDGDIRKNINRKLRDCSEKYNLKYMKTYPVILILDENLDSIPWELTSVLKKQLVTRMPSLHFTFALHKVHKGTIKNGYKIVENVLNGKYIINPGEDLVNMEKRFAKFFKYWNSTWIGTAGVTPSPKDFEDLLTTSDIFMYCGHGSGVQYLPSRKIEKLRINAVAFLFGCKSTALTPLGPAIEHIGMHYSYLIACSPCILGMLYNVTDYDTDCVTTALLSSILPSNADIHWKHVDKYKWHKTDLIVAENKYKSTKDDFEIEKDLLQAFLNAKQHAKYFITKAACVSRGLPIRFAD